MPEFFAGPVEFAVGAFVFGICAGAGWWLANRVLGAIFK